MMKELIVAFGLIAVVLAAPQRGPPPALGNPAAAEILRYESENIGVDGYRFAYETSDGTSRQEEAILKNPGTEQEALEVRGSFTWIAPDGQAYTVTFVADENGFRPEGAHLPK